MQEKSAALAIISLGCCTKSHFSIESAAGSAYLGFAGEWEIASGSALPPPLAGSTSRSQAPAYPLPALARKAHLKRPVLADRAPFFALDPWLMNPGTG